MVAAVYGLPSCMSTVRFSLLWWVGRSCNRVPITAGPLRNNISRGETSILALNETGRPIRLWSLIVPLSHIFHGIATYKVSYRRNPDKNNYQVIISEWDIQLPSLFVVNIVLDNLTFLRWSRVNENRITSPQLISQLPSTDLCDSFHFQNISYKNTM